MLQNRERAVPTKSCENDEEDETFEGPLTKRCRCEQSEFGSLGVPTSEKKGEESSRSSTMLGRMFGLVSSLWGGNRLSASETEETVSKHGAERNSSILCPKDSNEQESPRDSDEQGSAEDSDEQGSPRDSDEQGSDGRFDEEDTNEDEESCWVSEESDEWDPPDSEEKLTTDKIGTSEKSVDKETHDGSPNGQENENESDPENSVETNDFKKIDKINLIHQNIAKAEALINRNVNKEEKKDQKEAESGIAYYSQEIESNDSESLIKDQTEDSGK